MEEDSSIPHSRSGPTCSAELEGQFNQGLESQDQNIDIHQDPDINDLLPSSLLRAIETHSEHTLVSTQSNPFFVWSFSHFIFQISSDLKDNHTSEDYGFHAQPYSDMDTWLGEYHDGDSTEDMESSRHDRIFL